MPVVDRKRVVYKSRPYLEELKNNLETYIPNLLDESVPPKRETLIRTEVDKKFVKNDIKYDMYDVQLRGKTIINDIFMSHLLGANEVVVPHIIDEYTRLLAVVKDVISEHKRLNQFQELKGKVPAFDLKKIKSCLYDDLTQLSETFELNLDVKDLIKAV